MNTKKYVYLAAILAIMGSFALAIPAFADNDQEEQRIANPGQSDDFGKMMPVVVGKVSAINANILTVASATTTFTVDATNAKILRGETASAVSDITIGDNIIVQGTLTGTNVVATVIRDGKMGNGKAGDNNQALLQIQGNGQPVVAGTVSAINGSILTITNNGSTAYTIDATNAKIVQGKKTITLSAVKVGDSIIAQGTVNGTSVVASTIIDASAGKGARLGFFGSIGQFFKRLFGF